MDSFYDLWALAFMAGLWSFLSPCVLPMVPAYIAALSLEGGQGFWPFGLIKTLAFNLGVCLPFFVIGLLVSAKDFESPVIFSAIGLITIFWGLKRILWPVNYCSLKAPNSAVLNRKTLSSLTLGLISSFGWTACTGPLIAAIFGLTAGREGLSGTFCLLTVYGLGLTAPFFILSLGVYVFKWKLPARMGGSLWTVRLGGLAMAFLGFWLLWYYKGKISLAIFLSFLGF
jgi:cytochrome c biogenesis protein CcdA